MLPTAGQPAGPGAREAADLFAPPYTAGDVGRPSHQPLSISFEIKENSDAVQNMQQVFVRYQYSILCFIMYDYASSR